MEIFQIGQIPKIIAVSIIFWAGLCFLFQVSVLGFERADFIRFQISLPLTTGEMPAYSTYSFVSPSHKEYCLRPKQGLLASEGLHPVSFEKGHFSSSKNFEHRNYQLTLSDMDHLSINDTTMKNRMITNFDSYPDDNVLVRHPELVVLSLLALMLLIGAQIHWSDEGRF